MMKFRARKERYIRSIKTFREFLSQKGSLAYCTLQDIDFSQNGIDWEDIELDHTTFLGCNFRPEDELKLRGRGAYIYPRQPGLPYNPYRMALYSWQELMQGYQPDCDNSLDFKIYEHFSGNRYNPSINEALNQRIHDHAIDEALRTLLNPHGEEEGLPLRKCVGIMGGHGTLRTDENYIKVAQTAKMLTEAGFFVVSGGGPGIMEAANLGAWLGGESKAGLNEALAILAKAPHYKDEGYHEAAKEVLERFPQGKESLAIPTWFYGHEPSNLFATAIAKYFSNSIREDTLLAISLYGVVYAPGSAGTTQEIFQEATQNHYGTFNFYSPMVFLGSKRYEIDTLIYPLLRQLSYGQPYHDLLYLTDEPAGVLQFLLSHQPIRRGEKSGMPKSTGA